MAPQAKKINGPSAIRYLVTATTIYQRTVADVVSTIEEATAEGTLKDRERVYAALLTALAAVGRDLERVVERSQVLLGEATDKS